MIHHGKLPLDLTDWLSLILCNPFNPACSYCRRLVYNTDSVTPAIYKPTSGINAGILVDWAAMGEDDDAHLGNK
jgi:hypothetical protein